MAGSPPWSTAQPATASRPPRSTWTPSTSCTRTQVIGPFDTAVIDQKDRRHDRSRSTSRPSTVLPGLT